ncbi:MAG: DUF2130 domain-containing protein, partial [Clostridia bacterium]|nr:DUF2130 domain-containing protein [Clostridia bacterium]
MKELVCPKCGTTFSINESDYAELLGQVREKAFKEALKERSDEQDKKHLVELELAVEKATKAQEKALSDKDTKILELQNEIKLAQQEKQLEIQKTVQDKDQEIVRLKMDLQMAAKDKDIEITKLKEFHKNELAIKDEEIATYKDFKTKLSTKMIGESLEQYCLSEFNKVRMMAFPNAYFEKDNDDKSGSKGDFIYRETDENGVEILSIMFEMKNEADTTKTKHKNEDFFKELDKDRNEKKCEYAVLVSMLESDSEYYNVGIADVSYRYEKMFVVRPQFFLPIISLLRNAALDAMQYKTQLVEYQNRNLDIANFESQLNDFKYKFSNNVEHAAKNFHLTLKDLDGAIDLLQKMKKHLLLTYKQLNTANNQAEVLT